MRPYSDIWKTKKLIAESLVRSAGWTPSVRDVAISSAPQIFLYVWDMPSDWVWMCTASLEEFRKLSRAAQDGAVEAETVRGLLGSVIGAAADGRPPQEQCDMDWEEQLGLALSLYAGGTTTYKAANGFPEGGHFIVLNYRSAGARTSKLRPFAAPGRAQVPLSPEVLLAHKAQVLALDRGRHPEWFEDIA